MGVLKCGCIRGRTHGCSDSLGEQGHGNGKLQRAAALEQREALGMHQGLRCCSANSDGWAQGRAQSWSPAQALLCRREPGLVPSHLSGSAGREGARERGRRGISVGRPKHLGLPSLLYKEPAWSSVSESFLVPTQEGTAAGKAGGHGERGGGLRVGLGAPPGLRLLIFEAASAV